MTENHTDKTINLIIISEQLAQIDFVEKSLKRKLTINNYKSNNTSEIKNILSQENIDIIIVDDAQTTLDINILSGLLHELNLQIPLLQLARPSKDKKQSDFIAGGASTVCPYNDSLSILYHTELLLDYQQRKADLSGDASAADDYREKFDELYQSIADPMCYLQDGLFIDCNAAFLRVFDVSEKKELEELTILNFIERKSQHDFKLHLKKSTRRDLSSAPVIFYMQTLSGTPVELNIMSKPTKYNGQDVVQLYMRSSQAGGGAEMYDESTGLANRNQMDFFLFQKIEDFAKNEGYGYLTYLMIKNYRDVWGSDGFVEAEKFIQSVAKHVKKVLPAHTENSRYTDDGLVLYIPSKDSKQTEEVLSTLIKGLDQLTPEGMVRMVEPICFASFDKITKDSDYLNIISQLFRTARNNGATDGSRVARPAATEVAKKDMRRLATLNEIIKNQWMQLRFQPIASFQPDGVHRYRECLVLKHEEQDDIELDLMISTAERYQVMHNIDKWKINYLLDLLLEIDSATRENLQFFVLLSIDSLNNTNFVHWLVEQMKHTGLGGKNFVFELPVDSVLNAYTGALELNKAVRKCGGKVAITKVGSLMAGAEKIIDDIQPAIIKLDIREIDTLDDNEEAEVMTELKEKAQAVKATLIAEYIMSAAQLARIWPYDITLIQGRAMTPVLNDLDFNFDEFSLL